MSTDDLQKCANDSPFYLSINHKYKPGSYWFKKVPFGIHMIDGMIKKLAKDCNLTGKKTNHSARKTQVQTLCATGVSDSAVMQLSGDKSVQSLNHYKRPSLEQEKNICLICSATTIHCHCLRSYSHLLQFQSSSHHF